MRSLRSGGRSPTGAALEPGPVANTTALIRSLDAAIVAAKPDSTVIMAWTVELRPLHLAQWSQDKPPPQAAMARAIAERLMDREAKLVFISGSSDRIAGFVYDLRRRGDADRIASELLVALRQPFDIDGQIVHFDAKIGTAMVDGDNAEDGEVLDASQLALDAADHSTRHRSFSPRLRQERVSQDELRGDLEAAVRAKSLTLRYQPIVDVEDNQLTGIETFVGWSDQSRGAIEPSVFLPMIECTDLIYDLGEFVLARSYETVSDWVDRGLLQPTTLWINVTPTEILRSEFRSQVRSVVDPSSGVSLGIGLRDGPALGEKQLTERLRELAHDDVRTAVDEFGGNFSVAGGPESFPADTVRLEQRLVRALDDSVDNKLTIQLINDFAARRGISVVASGIETTSQLNAIRDIGIRLVKGFHVSPPMEADQFAESLSTHRWSIEQQ